MKRIRFAFALRVIVALCAVTLIARPAQAITFGEVDVDNRFPNIGTVVVIHELPQFAGVDVPWAGGSATLIHPRILLTAGHLTALVMSDIENGLTELDDLRVSFGTNALDPSTWIEVDGFITHPDFAFFPTATSQDVGVIILNEPVDFPCATLAYEGLLDDLKDARLLRVEGVPERFLAVGYGATLEFAPPEMTAGDGRRRYSFSDYRALESNWLLLNQNPATGNGGTGPGDSGGPRFWIAPNGELVLVAVTSRGDPELVSLDQAYRLDTASALDFIEFVIALVKEGTL